MTTLNPKTIPADQKNLISFTQTMNTPKPSKNKIFKNVNEEDCCCGIVFLVCSVIFLTVGLILYFAVYRMSTYDDRYAKGKCIITNSSISSKCYANYCNYYGNYHIMYNGKIIILEGDSLMDFKTHDLETAKLYLMKIGTEISCYYPTKDIIPLRIDASVLSGNRIARGWAIVLFVITCVMFLCFVISIYMAFSAYLK